MYVDSKHGKSYTECVIKTVPSVYTILINTISLSNGAQVAEGTVFRKHTVLNNTVASVCTSVPNSSVLSS